MELNQEQKEWVIEYLRGYIIKDCLDREERYEEIKKEVYSFVKRVNEVFGSDMYEDYIKLRKEKLYGDE